MDIALPEMDGWETMRQLKARLSTRKILVIAVAGHTWGKDQIAAAGCDAYLQKPCGPDDLVRTIRSVMAA